MNSGGSNARTPENFGKCCPPIPLELIGRRNYLGIIVVKKPFSIPNAMLATLEKTIGEILQDVTFTKAAAQRLSMTAVELDTNLSIRMAILNKCVRSVVALCAQRARGVVRRNTTNEASMIAWVDLLNKQVEDILHWVRIGATPHQMQAFQRVGIRPEQVGQILEEGQGRVTITRLLRDPSALFRR